MFPKVTLHWKVGSYNSLCNSMGSFDKGLIMNNSAFTGASQFTPDVYMRHKYACDSPSSCMTNLYSIECSLGEKIAMKGVFYGAKPYTPFCPNTMACVPKKRCCEHHKDDCLIPYYMKEMWDVFALCSQGQQCGWLYAKSTELKDNCKIRKKSNYIRADYQCISGM